MKNESLFVELPSIVKFMSGVIAGIGLTLSLEHTSYFLVLTGIGLVIYAVIIENERAKKNPPTVSEDLE